MTAYYNEIDPYAAQWLRNLISGGHIAPGDVDERSIVDVQSDDLRGYRQCHFFAGIGGWSRALRLAGWADDRPVWTGSCPCQPFSAASVGHGGAKGQRDERHLWPEFFRLIRERAPDILFGEQVDDAVSWGWWDTAALDLEDEDYACAAQILRADSFGAVHQRKRLFWVAHSSRTRREGYQPHNGLSVTAQKTFTIDGDPLDRAWRILVGCNSNLLPDDGLPVAVERLAAKGYGNAIVPKVAAEFIGASMMAICPQEEQ
jgi:DNA (cytosine-5)-methyltransferase 1